MIRQRSDKPAIILNPTLDFDSLNQPVITYGVVSFKAFRNVALVAFQMYHLDECKCFFLINLPSSQ